MAQPVSTDVAADLDDSPESPPPLIIDTPIETTISSPLHDSNFDKENRSNEKFNDNFNSPRTPFRNNRSKENLSNNIVNLESRRDVRTNINEREITTNSNTTNINRYNKYIC